MARKCNLDKDLAEKDPIMKLGYGITAYRNIMWSFFVMFCILTVLCIPAFVVYGNGGGYHYGKESLAGKEKYSLGNLGYSSTQCTQVYMGISSLTLNCPYGTIGQIIEYGVNDVKDGVSPQLCTATSESAFCNQELNDVAIQSVLNQALNQEQ